MAKEITCNTDSLRKSIESAQNYLNKITKNLDALYDSAKVLDGMWEGPAHDTFDLQFYDDQQDMKSMCETIQKIIDCMTYANDEYNTCEKNVASLVSSIRI